MATTMLEMNNNIMKFDKEVDNKYNYELAKDTRKDDKLTLSQKSAESDDDQNFVVTALNRSSISSKISQQKTLDDEQTFDKPSDTDSEPENDVYNLTADQRRAMLELLAQKQEDADILDEEPPEYNVKGRLEQLNAELANDPMPSEKEREQKVAFKSEIVDLVAPPPEYSDDESQSLKGDPLSSHLKEKDNSPHKEESLNSPHIEKQSASSHIEKQSASSHIERPFNSPIKEPLNSTLKSESQNSHIKREPPVSLFPEKSENSALINIQNNSKDTNGKEEQDSYKNNIDDENRKQFVVERDGQFSLLSGSELSPTEKSLFITEDARDNKVEKPRDNEKIKGDTNLNRSSSAGGQLPNGTSQVPKPPPQPRPHTSSSIPKPFTRKNHHQNQKPSFQTNLTDSTSTMGSLLDNFNYNSPYAMTSEQKTQAREAARKREEERREINRKNKEEVDKRIRENQNAFQAWLCKKMEEDKKKSEADGDKNMSEQDRRRVNEDVYKAWLHEKKIQINKEKLLKKRQQQDRMKGLVLHSPEECDKAFNLWLKKKNALSKKQISMERQTNKMYKMQMQHSRKIQALIKSLKESETCSFVDYYGYRF